MPTSSTVVSTQSIGGTAGGLVNTASGLLNPVTGSIGGVSGLLNPVIGAVGSTSGLLNPVAGALGGATGLLNPITGALGGISSGGSVGGANGLLGPVTSTVGSVTGLLNPVTGTLGGVAGLLNPVTGSVSGLTGGLLSSTGSTSSANGSVSGILGGLGLGTVGSTVNNLPLVGSLTGPLGITNLQSAPTNGAQTFGIEDAPSIVASLGGGKYLTSLGTVVMVPQAAQGLIGNLPGVSGATGDLEGQAGGAAAGLQSQIGNAVSGLQSQVGGVTTGGVTASSQFGNAGSSLGQIANIGNLEQGVARYVQIGGQLVPLNAAGQIIGLAETTASLPGVTNGLQQAIPASAGFAPINYLQSNSADDDTEGSDSTDPDAMDLVAQAMSGGKYGEAEGDFDGSSWRKGWESEDNRIKTATMTGSSSTAWTTAGATSSPDAWASATTTDAWASATPTDAWNAAAVTGAADAEEWGGWVSAGVVTSTTDMATATGSVTSSWMTPSASAGLS